LSKLRRYLLRRGEIGDAAFRASSAKAPCPDVLPIPEYLDVIFFNTDRMRTALPRRARFATDEAMIEFTRRAGGPKTLEDRNILGMTMQNKSGEITLELTDEQYDKLRRA
jgi:hypothetical protein